MPFEDAPLRPLMHHVIQGGPNYWKWKFAVGFIAQPLVPKNVVEFSCVHGDDSRYSSSKERIQLVAVAPDPSVPNTYQFAGFWLGDQHFDDPPRPVKYAIGFYTVEQGKNESSGWFDYYHDASMEAASHILVPKVTLSWGFPAIRVP